MHEAVTKLDATFSKLASLRENSLLSALCKQVGLSMEQLKS